VLVNHLLGRVNSVNLFKDMKIVAIGGGEIGRPQEIINGLKV